MWFYTLNVGETAYIGGTTIFKCTTKTVVGYLLIISDR